MISKIITFVMLGGLWLSAAAVGTDDCLDIRENRMKSLEFAVERTKECLIVMGCVALDFAIIQGFDQEEGSKLTKIAITTSKVLFPEIIEGVAGKSYRDQFTQALLVAGLCLAPEFTIGSYAAVWLAKKVGEKLDTTSVIQRAGNYWAARVGGYCFGAAVSRFSRS